MKIVNKDSMGVMRYAFAQLCLNKVMDSIHVASSSSLKLVNATWFFKGYWVMADRRGAVVFLI
jgi:hypothetical protein